MNNVILSAATILFCSVGFAQTSSTTAATSNASELQKVETRKAAPSKGGCCSMAEGKAGCADKSAKPCAPKSVTSSSERRTQKRKWKAKN
tara:strand:+ start:602 stop:871 length:270 start_codon:yes stop_codon:yes gene_type:complete